MRLIDADKLLEKECCGRISGDDVRNAPTITPDNLRPHGWWVDIYRLEVKPEWICRCSLCGCPQDFKHHYCPNCGAKMDVEREDTKQ